LGCSHLAQRWDEALARLKHLVETDDASG